ncbi:hypothetical protein INT44_005522 [Umbelopsis vinacea]|uniref:Uncharacterized protein n=1 Tax=Umbelopsis vinacea TaxID=44442 RepID=A0A8H7Q882_9FUNG|nr:hypothetical protein INT44_005522 [Umbelopsis vinacea]
MPPQYGMPEPVLGPTKANSSSFTDIPEVFGSRRDTQVPDWFYQALRARDEIMLKAPHCCLCEPKATYLGIALRDSLSLLLNPSRESEDDTIPRRTTLSQLPPDCLYLVSPPQINAIYAISPLGSNDTQPQAGTAIDPLLMDER